MAPGTHAAASPRVADAATAEPRRFDRRGVARGHKALRRRVSILDQGDVTNFVVGAGLQDVLGSTRHLAGE
eukprot:6639646-Prymnesium_polylepis.1